MVLWPIRARVLFELFYKSPLQVAVTWNRKSFTPCSFSYLLDIKWWGQPNATDHMGYLTSYSQSALVEMWRNNLCSCLCSDNRSDAMLLRGSVFFIGMCLWGSQRVPNLKYSSSTVLPSMLQVGISSYYTAFKNTVDLLLSPESHSRFCWFSFASNFDWS